MEIEVNATEWFVRVGLAKHEGDMPVERESVPEAGAAIFVGGNGFFQQRLQAAQKILGDFIDANHKFFVIASRVVNLFLKVFNLEWHDGGSISKLPAVCKLVRNLRLTWSAFRCN